MWPAPSRRAFDAAAEQSRLAEVVVGTAAQLVASDGSPLELIERKCQLLTARAPNIVLAWTWFGPPQADQLRPQVVAGRASAYAQALVIERTALTTIGPAFRTLAGRRLEPFNVSTVSLHGPWRAAAREHGVRSVLALPLRSWHDEQRGLFVLYSSTEGYFDQVGVGLFEALAQLFSAVLSRAARNAELAHAAYRDALTGLHNRGALTLLTASLQRVSALDPPVALMMIDLDHFKRINDDHGHAAGDEVLCLAAQRLRASLRHDDVLLRWGGEEFMVGLADVSQDKAQGIAEKLRQHVAGQPCALASGLQVQVTVSIGLAALGVGEDILQGLERADAALYRAKRSGRNQVAHAERQDAKDLAVQAPSSGG